MGLVGLASFACVWPGLIPTEIVVVVIWLRSRDRSASARQRLNSLGIVLGSVYLVPIANFFLLPLFDPAWAQLGPEWRRYWSPIFPIAPGALPILVIDVVSHFSSVVVRYVRPGALDVVFALLAALLTAALVYALTALAGQSRGRRACAIAIALVVSACGTVTMTGIVIASGV